MSLVNFKVKSTSSETFLNEHDIGCSNFLGHNKHVTWGVRTPWCCMGCLNVIQNRRDFSCPNLFYFILFYFFYLNMYLNCVCWLMIYSVFNSNLLLIWGCNLAINKASLILRLPTLCTIASILMEKLLFLHLIKCLRSEDACMLKCSLILISRSLIVLPI